MSSRVVDTSEEKATMNEESTGSFCGQCGASIIGVRFCTHCGSPSGNDRAETPETAPLSNRGEGWVAPVLQGSDATASRHPDAGLSRRRRWALIGGMAVAWLAVGVVLMAMVA
jgi:hypothetical protein